MSWLQDERSFAEKMGEAAPEQVQLFYRLLLSDASFSAHFQRTMRRKLSGNSLGEDLGRLMPDQYADNL